MKMKRVEVEVSAKVRNSSDRSGGMFNNQLFSTILIEGINKLIGEPFVPNQFFSYDYAAVFALSKLKKSQLYTSKYRELLIVCDNQAVGSPQISNRVEEFQKYLDENNDRENVGVGKIIIDFCKEKGLNSPKWYGIVEEHIDGKYDSSKYKSSNFTPKTSELKTLEVYRAYTIDSSAKPFAFIRYPEISKFLTNVLEDKTFKAAKGEQRVRFLDDLFCKNQSFNKNLFDALLTDSVLVEDDGGFVQVFPDGSVSQVVAVKENL